jgi:hypothetical protein
MRIAVYTVVTPGYDSVRKLDSYVSRSLIKFIYISYERPKTIPEGWDYFFIPKLENEDDFSYNRRLKFTLIEDFDVDYSIYIDGNVVVNCKRFYLLEDYLVDSNLVYAVSRHWSEGSFIEELTRIKRLAKSRGQEDDFVKMLNFEGVDVDNLVLTENNIILKSHNLSVRKELEEFLYLIREFLSRYKVRDQLVTPYVVSLFNFSITDFPYGVRSSFGIFKLILHEKELKTLSLLNKFKFWLKGIVGY